MNRINVLDEKLSEIASIDDVVLASRTEIINSDNTLSFSVLLTKQNTTLFNATNVYELDSDYFDLSKYKKGQSEDGKLTCAVDCEHVSYRLNNAEYDKEFFAETGAPSSVLSAILAGTDFSVGNVEFTDPVTYSAQENKSRRALLVQFTEYLGGELLFHGFAVSIVRQRGSTAARNLVAEGCVSVISKTLDKTRLDASGNPTIAYECTTYGSGIAPLSLGDTVLLDYATLDIGITLRIVSLTTNPYDKYDVSFSVSNVVPAIEDAAYEIATSTVGKDALMNGCRIGPEYGFEAVRNGKKARAYFRSDGMALQSGDGSGTSWTDRLKYEYDADKGETTLVFNGKLSADLIEALSAIITPNLYAEKATISELTVDRLDTSDKVQKYLSGDTTEDNYQSIYDQWHEFVTATKQVGDPVQAVDRDGNPLYWTDAAHKAATTTNTGLPVLTYPYATLTKLKLGFDLDPSGSGFQIPMLILGAGAGNTDHPDWGKSFIYEGIDGLYMEHYSASDGSLRRISLTDDGIVLTPYALLSLDFYSNGFRAAYQGEAVAMTWTLDSSGVITALVTEDNVTIPVNWHEEDM